MTSVYQIKQQTTFNWEYWVTYCIINIFQYGGKRLDEIGWNIGDEAYGVSIENDNAVW